MLTDGDGRTSGDLVPEPVVDLEGKDRIAGEPVVGSELDQELVLASIRRMGRIIASLS